MVAGNYREHVFSFRDKFLFFDVYFCNKFAILPEYHFSLRQTTFKTPAENTIVHGSPEVAVRLGEEK